MKLDAYTNLDEIANVSVASLTNDQKTKLLKKLVYEFKKDNITHLDKFFELIDTFPYKNLRLNLIEQTIIPMMNKGMQYILRKETLLRYKNKNESIDVIVSNNIQYNEYKLDLSKKVLKTMNSKEVCALLVKCEHNKEIRNYILNNYSDKVDYQTLLQVSNTFVDEGIIKAYDSLNYQDKIKYIRENKDRHEILISRIDNLKDSDRLYLELSVDKINLTKIDKDSFIEFINKYPDEIDDFYYGDVCLFFNNEELKEIANQVKSEKLHNYIENEIIYREYSSLDKKQKKDYLSKLDVNFIDRNFYLLSNDLDLFDKKMLLKKLDNIEINNERFARHVISTLTNEELKKHNIKVSLLAACALDKIEEDYVNKNINDKDKRLLLQTLILKANKENENFKYKTLLIDLLKSSSEIKNNILLNQILSFEEKLEVIKVNSSLVNSIDFTKLNEEELLRLKEYAQDNDKYVDEVLNKKEYKENDKFSTLQIDLLSRYHQYSLPKCVNINMLNDTFNNKKSLVNILPYVSNNVMLFKEMLNKGLDEKILTSLDDSLELLELYKSIKTSDNEYVNEDLKRTFFDNISKINDSKEILLKLKQDNPNVMTTLNYKLLDILEGKNLEYFARYEGLKSLREFKDNSRELVSLLTNRILETRKYKDDVLEKCLTVVSSLNKEQINNLLNKDVDEVIYLMNKNPLVVSGNIEDYKVEESNYCDKAIHSDDIEIAKDAYFREKCNMSLEDVKRLSVVYGKDLDALKELYENDKDISKYLESLKRMQDILKINNNELLVSMYEKTKPIDNFRFPFDLEENLKIAYNKELINSVYKPNKDDLIENNVYKVNGEFNLLVSVIGAFVENKDSLDNPSENWNDNEKLVNHGICSSLIANNNLSFVYDKDKLIYGFNNLEDSSLLNVASYDLSSNSNSIGITTLKDDEYRVSKGMVSYTREGHNELIIERRKDNSNNKRQPDYIVAIDKVRDIDYKASKEFNVPIVLLDINQIAKTESEKLFNLYKECKVNPSKDNLDILIDSYHSNYAGLTTINKKLNARYFNERKFEKMLNELIDYIKENKLLLNDFKNCLLKEEKKRETVNKKFHPFSFDKLKEKIDKNLLVVNGKKFTISKRS